MGAGFYPIDADFAPEYAGGASCYICKSDRRPREDGQGKEPIIWLGVDIEFEGRPYVCYSCIRQAWEAMSEIVPDRQKDTLRNGRRTDGRRIASLEKQLSLKDDIISALQADNELLRDENKSLRRK